MKSVGFFSQDSKQRMVQMRELMIHSEKESWNSDTVNLMLYWYSQVSINQHGLHMKQRSSLFKIPSLTKTTEHLYCGVIHKSSKYFFFISHQNYIIVIHQRCRFDLRHKMLRETQKSLCVEYRILHHGCNYPNHTVEEHMGEAP